MAAVLTCGRAAVLSHESAAALWKINEEKARSILLTIPASMAARPPSLIAHRRSSLPPTDVTTKDGIPVTTPVRTLLDVAVRLTARELEAVVNKADRLGLIDPEAQSWSASSFRWRRVRDSRSP
jgi:hypothetical protein